MELMATPRASAISPISGAAVPEEGEIPSTRVRARCRRTLAMQLAGCIRALECGDLTWRRYFAERSFPERAEGKSASIESREASLAGGRRSGKLRAKLISDLVETTGVRRGRLRGSPPDFTFLSPPEVS